jgi:FAD dependent oxidoreductase
MKNVIAQYLLVLVSMTAFCSVEAASSNGGPILLEAEAFASHGGWVVDPQFMDIMGSPYLLAHGLGRPVADAKTEMNVPVAGSYRVWVRTKDWVARWKASGAPGKFQVLVNGKALEPTFGTVGAEWHWQDGGSIELPAGKVSLSLHDLTGFEGRCDAILLSRDAQFIPPNKDPEMAVFRRACLGQPEQPETAGEFDLVVTGGGIAGTCAALSAARLGLKVALIQDRPVLGGNNSSEVRVWLQGARNKEPWPRIGDVVTELEQQKSAHYGPSNTPEIYEDEKKLALVRAETNITLVLEHRVNGAVVEEGRIRAVIAQSTRTGRRQRFIGKYFADCTGDASVGALAGADFEMEPKGRMGPCNLWNVAPTQEAVSFPRCPWALDLSDKPFPGREKKKADPDKLGGWYWESGFDWEPMQEMEYVRDWNFRAMYGAWDALKNVDKVLPNYALNWSAHILGKRESRRLMGDVVLTFDDLTKDRQFPDDAAPTGWSNDLHYPDPKYTKGFEGNAFISHAIHGKYPAYIEKRPFWVPYRSLYSRNISNLFMAGRNISVKHEALGAVRVMRTGGCMGEVVGMAASLCVRNDATPRVVFEKHLGDLRELMRRGTGKSEAPGVTK